MRWLTLAAWLLTAGGGSVLLGAWVRHRGPSQTEGLRPTRLVPHVALAVTGLLVWVAYLVWAETWLAWLAVGLLVLVAAIGAALFAIHWRGRTRADHTTVPAEASFPLPVVLGHGLLGATTLVLALLTATGIG